MSPWMPSGFLVQSACHGNFSAFLVLAAMSVDNLPGGGVCPSPLPPDSSVSGLATVGGGGGGGGGGGALPPGKAGEAPPAEELAPDHSEFFDARSATVAPSRVSWGGAEVIK